VPAWDQGQREMPGSAGSAILGRGAGFQPGPEGGGGGGEPPFVEDVPGHRPERSKGWGVGTIQAAVEKPGLEDVGIGIICDCRVEQRALERHAERVRGRVALAPTAPAVGGLEGREERTTEGRGAQRGLAHVL
jgi:hypothetical protein